MASALSCTDQGDVVNHLAVVAVSPAPNSTGVDKATIVSIQFDRGVSVNEGAKIRMRYVDGTDPVNSFAGGGHMAPVGRWLSAGPFIWKPGRTVEVTIPKEIADPDGNTLSQSIVYQFATARDTVPFDLVQTVPAQDDTVALSGPYHYIYGTLTFNDYVSVRDSTLTISPPADLHVEGMAIADGRPGPVRRAWFSIRDVQPNTNYTITIPQNINDYEGETLPREYHIVFHTRP